MPARTAARRKSRERIGADDARVWARELRLRNPYAKSILLAIANYMNEDGTAFPGLATIARDTDISEDVCAKRLRWLEEIGAIALFKCWRDDAGRRNYEGRGKPTSTEIRFLFDSDRHEIEDRAEQSASDRPLRGAARRSHERVADESSDEGAETCETDDISTRHGRGNQHPASTQLAPEQPPPPAAPESGVHMNARARLELEQESQPQTPSKIEGAFDRVASRLQEFQEAYPIPITDLDKTEMQWRGLTDDERAEAITGARGYAALLKAQPKRTAEDAHRWLRGRKWQGYVAAGKQAEAVAKWSYADEGSERWQAAEIYYQACGYRTGIPSFLIGGTAPNRKANLPWEWPPVGRGVDPDRSKWVTHAEPSGQFAAWLRRLSEVPNPKIMFGQKIDGSRYLRTLTVPSEWPPGKAESSAA